MLALWVRQEAAVFPLFVEWAMTQNEMPVKSFAAPIVAVLAVAALILGLILLPFSSRCCHSPCHSLLFCEFKCVPFILLGNLLQGFIHVVTMPEHLDGFTL